MICALLSKPTHIICPAISQDVAHRQQTAAEIGTSDASSRADLAVCHSNAARRRGRYSAEAGRMAPAILFIVDGSHRRRARLAIS